jgi:periplasmic protein TonB
VTGPLARVGAALTLSAALHTLVLAGAPTLFPAGAPGGTPPASIDVRLLGEAPAASSSPKVRPRKPGSDLATGPQLGVAGGPRYFRASELDTKPQPLTAIEPAPPAGAGKLAGRVIARVLINEAGRADAVRVEASEPYAVFDDAVKTAFGSARYRPGTKDGRKVKSQMLIEVTFHGEAAGAEGSARTH